MVVTLDKLFSKKLKTATPGKKIEIPWSKINLKVTPKDKLNISIVNIQ